MQHVPPGGRVIDLHRGDAVCPLRRVEQAEHRFGSDVVHRAGLVPPTPGVAEPQGGQRPACRFLGAAVHDRDTDQDVLLIRLGVLDEHVEVAALVEDAGVEQLVLGIVVAAPLRLRHQLPVGERGLRVLVEHLQVAVRGRAVQVEVALLDVLAVVALDAGQAEQPLLEDRVASVPQRDGEAQVLGAIADAGQAVLVPAVRAAGRVIVRKVVPRRTVSAVVFAYRAPRPFAEVRPPLLPVGRTRLMGGEARVFRRSIHHRGGPSGTSPTSGTRPRTHSRSGR